MPGLPGEKKQYDVLTDIRKSGGNVMWLTYTGTYENKSGNVFSLKSCVEDANNILRQMEKKREPYIIVAYSFSSIIVRMIDFSRYKNCSGVLVYSPISDLNYSSSHGDFPSLLENLKQTNSIERSGSWSEPTPTLGQWLTHMNSCHIPTIVFSGASDETRPSQSEIDEADSRKTGKISYTRVLQIAPAAHKINSYSSTIATWCLWGLITKILLDQAVRGNHKYCLWGSTLESITWSKYSDVDILIIGNIEVSDYGRIATVAKYVESVSGIHVGISINKPSDLERSWYIRRNRSAVFLRELKTNALPLSKGLIIRDVSNDDVVSDALNTNRIIRAEISKQLLGYYTNKSVVKSIIKSYMQAVRLAQYSKSGSAQYETIFSEDSESARLFRRCKELKDNNYRDVSFEYLNKLYVSIDDIVQQQERHK